MNIKEKLYNDIKGKKYNQRASDIPNNVRKFVSQRIYYGTKIMECRPQTFFGTFILL